MLIRQSNSLMVPDFLHATRDLQQLEEFRRIRNMVFPIIEAPVGGWGFIPSTQPKAAPSKLFTSSRITGCMLKERGTFHHDHDCTLQEDGEDEAHLPGHFFLLETWSQRCYLLGVCRHPHLGEHARAQAKSHLWKVWKASTGIFPRGTQPNITDYDFLMLDESALQHSSQYYCNCCNGNFRTSKWVAINAVPSPLQELRRGFRLAVRRLAIEENDTDIDGQ